MFYFVSSSALWTSFTKEKRENFKDANYTIYSTFLNEKLLSAYFKFQIFFNLEIFSFKPRIFFFAPINKIDACMWKESNTSKQGGIANCAIAPISLQGLAKPARRLLSLLRIRHRVCTTGHSRKFIPSRIQGRRFKEKKFVQIKEKKSQHTANSAREGRIYRLAAVRIAFEVVELVCEFRSIHSADKQQED